MIWISGQRDEAEKEKERRKDLAKVVARAEVQGTGDPIHWASVSAS